MKPAIGSLFIALLILGVRESPAQVAAGTIVGVVEDTTGAIVPNAAVTALHVATSDSRQTRSNERGEFSFPFVRIGEYSISAEVAGFKKATLTGITVRVDQTVSIRVGLEVGTVAETVEVTGSAPLIDSATSSLGQVIENKKILDLPLNGRNTFALGLLAGNTIPMTGMGTNLPFVSGGGRFQENDVLLDGIDNNTSATNGGVGVQGIAYTPAVDAVEEFKVKTNNYSAEFGRSAGAIVSAAIKSGTNQYHGSTFEFLRNEVLDANNFFSNAGGVKRQPFKQNQFGYTLGGPVVIPKLYDGHNRTFFFTDFEGTRRRTSASSTILDIAPMDFRSGDFSKYNRPIYDPRSRRAGPNGVVSTPLPNNQVPQSLINPASAAIVNILPTPNFGAPGAQARNYLRIASRRFDNDQFDSRVDHRLGSANSLFGRFSFSNAFTPDPGSFDSFLGGGPSATTANRSAVLGDTHIFSPTVVNEFRFGYLRNKYSSVPNGLEEGVAFANKNKIGLFPFPVQTFPGFNFNYSGLINTTQQFSSFGGGSPNIAVQNTFHVADNINIVHGNHSFKTGGELRRYRFDRITGGGSTIYGSIFSSSSDSAGSGAPFADFLLGYPAGADGTQLLNWDRTRDLYVGFYFQDDWKATRKLTLNMGARYELYTQPVDALDNGGFFNIATKQMALPGRSGFTRSIVDGDHNNFAPRLGLAYAVTPRFTLRSGGGFFFARRDQNLEVTHPAGNIPNTPTISFPVVSATSTITPPVTINDNIAVGPSDPTFAGFTPERPLSFVFRAPDFHNIKNPYVIQWNLSLQYEILRNLAVTAAYSGSKGTRLVNRVNLNQLKMEDALAGRNRQTDRLFPFNNNIVGYDCSCGNSEYNALNLRLEKRFAAGLNFLLNYTWAKDMQSGGNGAQAWSQNGGTVNPLDSWNLRREHSYGTLDVPHVLTASYEYELPFGSGKPWLNRRGPLNVAFGGWQVNGITYFRSGFVTDIRSTRVAANDQLFATLNVPDRVSGVSMYLPNKGVDGYFNPAAFTEPATVRNVNGAPIILFGNAARRVGRGPGSTNFDVSMFKNFRIVERVTIQLRGEAFNVSNTPTFFLPAASNTSLAIGNPNFGKLSSSSATGRQIQLGLKVLF